MTTHDSPDGGFDPRPLNEQFYSAEPAMYFRHRLHLLALVAGRRSDVDNLLSEGLEYDGLHLVPDSSEEPMDAGHTDEDARYQLAYLTTESQVLLHHAAEALIRLFLAHAIHPVCPWFECARLTDFRKFHEETERLDKGRMDGIRDDASTVFLGGAATGLNKDLSDALDASLRLMQLLWLRRFRPTPLVGEF